jgi:hypothetical protein
VGVVDWLAAREGRQFAGVDPTALVWAADPMKRDDFGRFRALTPTVPLIDLSFVLSPAVLPKDFSTVMSLQAKAPSGYVLCLAGRGLDGVTRDDTSIVIAGDRQDAKDAATTLLQALGRRTRDLGPLEAVRYLDHVTLNWFATV